MKPSITFWQVLDAKQKVNCVCQLVHKHFHQAQRQIIMVPNQQAAEYIDKLLWKHPSEAFVPHVVATEPLPAAVVITTTQCNLNQAQVVINLCPDINPAFESATIVHELWDKTDPSKEQLSQKRYQMYQQTGFKTALLTPS